MKKRKILMTLMTAVLCVAAVASLAACGKKQQETDPVIDYTQEEPTLIVDENQWEISENDISNISDEDKAVFEKGLEGLAGMGYEPIACVATQVVAGENLLFIAKGTMVYPGAKPALYAIRMYKDLEGNVTPSNVFTTIDLDYLDNIAEISPASEEGIAGGWNIRTEYPHEAKMTDAQIESFKIENDGVIPIAFLGSKSTEDAMQDAYLCADTIFNKICIVIVTKDNVTGEIFKGKTTLDMLKLVDGGFMDSEIVDGEMMIEE